MKNKTLLLFDFNNLLMKSIYTLPGLYYNGIYTGGLYGFLMQIAKYISIHNPSTTVICNDKPPYKRKTLYENYKSDRKTSNEDFVIKLRTSRKICYEVIEKTSIPIVEYEGLEADDIIANFVLQFHNEFERIIICSNDSDLFQLFESTNVYLDRGAKGMYGYNEFKREYNIEPSQWVDILSLCGSHNGIPPIEKGIGEKTAIKIMKDKNKYIQMLEKYSTDIEIRKNIVKIPFETIDINSILTKKKNSYSFENFTIFLKRKYNFNKNKSFGFLTKVR